MLQKNIQTETNFYLQPLLQVRMSKNFVMEASVKTKLTLWSFQEDYI